MRHRRRHDSLRAMESERSPLVSVERLANPGCGRRGIDGEWVGVLDGGIKAWAEAGEALAHDVPEAPAASRLTSAGLAIAWHGVIERDELRSRLGSVTLLDARAAARY